MSDSAAGPVPGSRAIRIPLQPNKSNDYKTSSRRRRGTQCYGKALVSSDAGSSSLGSDQGSSWSFGSPSIGAHGATRLQTSIASPTENGLRLASGDSMSNSSATPSQRKDKQKAVASSPASPPNYFPASSPLGPSMLSSSSYKSINLNSHHGEDDSDEPPRLITYTKHSQGFTWNDELFLPGYMLGRYGGRRRKEFDADFGDDDRCPVAEIFVTDEEAEAMMP